MCGRVRTGACVSRAEDSALLRKPPILKFHRLKYIKNMEKSDFSSWALWFVVFLDGLRT